MFLVSYTCAFVSAGAQLLKVWEEEGNKDRVSVSQAGPIGVSRGTFVLDGPCMSTGTW